MTGDTIHRRVELASVGDGAWRVCDGAIPENDGRRVVAFLERVDRHVEALWVRECHAPTRFDSIEEALDAADGVIEWDEPDRSSRPVPIRHFAPRPPKAIA